MTRRLILPLWLFLVGHGLFAAALPNIVFIMADDLGYGDLGCYGQQIIETPRLDALAREGMRFTQHYAGNTVCAPARCSLMTGKHPGHAYVRGNMQAADSEGQLPIPDEEVTIAEVLRNAGYVTGMFGKWGLGNPGTTGDPLEQGWDTYFGYTDQVRAHNYFPDFLLRDGERVPLDNKVRYLSKDAWHKGIGSYSTEQNVYSHDLIAEAALDFVREHRDKPFFLYLPFTLPHDNGEAPRLQMEVPDFGRYAARKDWSLNAKGYAEMVTRLDASVGQVVDLLRALDLHERTLVLFTSDNGPVRDRDDVPDRRTTEFFDSNGPLRGYKGEVYEGGIRAPLIAWWPGRIAPGTTSNHLCAHWDFFATACEAAGVAMPGGLDSISYLPTLLGDSGKQKTPEYLYWEAGRQGYIAIRQGRWKGVHLGMKDRPWEPFEIYDLESDIGETTDVAPAHPVLQEAFRRIFREAHVPSLHFPLAVDDR